MKLKQLASVVFAVLLSGPTALAETVRVNSPDGHLKLTIEGAADGGVTHALAVTGTEYQRLQAAYPSTVPAK